MSSEFNFPANPTIGDIFTLPNGSEAKWNGTEWEIVASEVVYPITIDKGGTEAETAIDALFNLNGVNKAGDEMTGNLLLPILSVRGKNTATIQMNKIGDTQANDIWGTREENARWKLTLGSVTSEAGADTGSNFTITRYSDLGATLGDPFYIRRDNGDVNFNANVFIHGNQTINGTTLTIGNHTNSAVLLLDKADAFWGYVQGAQNGLVRWQMFLGDNGAESGANAGSNFSLLAFDDAGNYLNTPITIYRANGAVAFNAAPGVTVNGTAGMYIPNGAITAQSYSSINFTGITVAGVNGDGSTYSYQDLISGNPNWSWLALRSWLQIGQWAGFTFTGTSSMQFVVSNLEGWGYINALAFNVSSDVNLKKNIEDVPSALSIIDGIQARTYEFIPATDNIPREGTGDIPTFPSMKSRYAGSMSQDWQTRLPEAVTDSGDGTLMLDYAAIGAVTAQAVSELLQRVKALEAIVLQSGE
jgi:hypothetical protein